jgi:cytochrome c-type biogenesis protein CcmH/NrfG
MKIQLMRSKEIAKLLNKVWDNLQNGDAKKSLGILEEAVHKYPKDKWLALFSAEFYSVIGKDTKAIQKLNILLGKEPDFSEAWALLGEIYSKGNHFKKATQAYEKAVNLKPSESNWLDSLVTLYFMGKKTKMAGKLLRDALKVNPADHWFRLLLALTYLFENKPKQAFSIVKNVLEDHPNLLSGKANLGLYALNLAGTSKMENKEYTEAIEFFDEAIKINQNTYYNLAQCYLFNRNFKAALKYARLAISLDPQDYYYRELLGKIYLELFNWKKAVKAFKQAVHLGSDKLSTKISMCLSLYYAGDLEEACQKTLDLLAQHPADKYLQYLTACIYCRLNVIDKALQYLEQALNNGFPIDQVEPGEFSNLSDNPYFLSLIKPPLH